MKLKFFKKPLFKLFFFVNLALLLFIITGIIVMVNICHSSGDCYARGKLFGEGVFRLVICINLATYGIYKLVQRIKNRKKK